MEKKERMCNFCGLAESEVEFLVNGPGDLYICSVCIEQCMELWQDFQLQKKAEEDYVNSQK